MVEQSKVDDKPMGNFEGVLGLLVVIGIAWGLYALYSRFIADDPPVISLSAYFLDSNTLRSEDAVRSQLKVKGNVHQAGQPLKGGNIRLTVSRLDKSFQQTVSLDLKNGQFETEDPALANFRSKDQLRITAEVWSSQSREPTTHEIYLNSAPPVLTTAVQVKLWGVILILLSVFFFAFTGRKTPVKNRVAIIFSYIVIFLFLAIPLISPLVLLHAFPDLRQGMIGVPVGLIVTRVGNTVVTMGGEEAGNNRLETNERGEIQWAVNIGGYSTKMSSKTESPASDNSGMKSGAASEAIADAVPQSENSTSQDRSIAKVEGGLVIPLYVIILSVIGGAINMTRKVPRLQKEGEYAEVTVRPMGMPALFRRLLPSKSDSSKPPDPSSNKTDKISTEWPLKESKTEIETVEKLTVSQTIMTQTHSTSGGTEGAKNDESAESVATSGKAAVEPSIDEKAREIDSQLESLAEGQVKRHNETESIMAKIIALVQQMRGLFESNKDATHILGFASFDDWLANRPSLKELMGSNWRVELLNQYMYLISAPFLAIVAYYMLELLGLTKQPILVLISFSVGLISERILSWLLGIASGYLRSDANG